MNIGSVVLLAGAGFVGGTVNAVAGGGSLISFPALLSAGIPSVAANVTNTVALWPGYLGGAIGYRTQIRALQPLLIRCAAISLVGGVLGAVILLNTPGAAFEAIVPYLVLAGTLLFGIQPAVTKRIRARSPAAGSAAGSADRLSVGASTGVLAASVYGSYFGAGLGVMLLAVLGFGLEVELQQLNAIKNSLSLMINSVALVAFALFGPVRWDAVLIMAIASLAGGYLGSLAALRLPPTVLRAAVVTLGLVVSVALFVKE